LVRLLGAVVMTDWVKALRWQEAGMGGSTGGKKPGGAALWGVRNMREYRAKSDTPAGCFCRGRKGPAPFLTKTIHAEARTPHFQVKTRCSWLMAG
jgi:hypothetical protein